MLSDISGLISVHFQQVDIYWQAQENITQKSKQVRRINIMSQNNYDQALV